MIITSERIVYVIISYVIHITHRRRKLWGKKNMGKDTAARVLIMVKLWVGVYAYTL